MPGRVFSVSAAPGWGVEIVTLRQTSGERAAVSSGDLWYACETERVVFVLTPPAGVADPAAAALAVTLLDPAAVSGRESGLYTVEPVWGGAGSFGGLFANAPGDRVSAPVSLADGGVGVLFGGGEERAVRTFRAAAFRLTDRGMEPAEDPALQGLFPAGDLRAEALYLPEAAGTYAVLVLPAGADPATLTVTGGRAEVTPEHKLGGLFPMAQPVRYTAEGSPYPVPAPFLGTNYKYGQRCVGALLPAASVLRLRCDPRFEVSATLWAPDETGELKRKKTLWNGLQPGAELPRGFRTLENTETEGYLLICVSRRAEPLIDAAGAFTLQSRGMGGLRGYDEVSEGVLVDYAPGHTPSFTGITDPVVAQNLAAVTDLRAAHVYAGDYARPQDPDISAPYPEMFDLSPAWYSGFSDAQTFLRQVTPESYLSAAMNPNSRYYMYGSAKSYGCTCIHFVTALFGLKETCSLPQLYAGELEKYDRAPFDVHTDLDALAPCDLLLEYDPVTLDGHLLMVREVIRNASGAVAAVNAVEAYNPYARQRTFYNYPGVKMTSALLSSFTLEKLEAYSVRLRVKPAYERPLTELFDMSPALTKGCVMCDRGSGSVYCIGEPFAEFSVSDEAAEEVRVYRDGAFAAALPLAGAERRNGLRVVGFADLLTAPGLYTAVTDTAEAAGEAAAAAERFYVPPQKKLPRVLSALPADPAQGEVTVVLFDRAEVDCVYAYYKRADPAPASSSARAATAPAATAPASTPAASTGPSYSGPAAYPPLSSFAAHLPVASAPAATPLTDPTAPAPDTATAAETDPSPVYQYYVAPAERIVPADESVYGAGAGTLTLPASFTGRALSSVRVQYRTPYGSFWVACGGKQPLQSSSHR